MAWDQALGSRTHPTHGVLSMNSATQMSPQTHQLWDQNKGKNTKYSKMKKKRKRERSQVGRWVCSSKGSGVCASAGCNFGAGTNEMYTERGGSSQKAAR